MKNNQFLHFVANQNDFCVYDPDHSIPDVVSWVQAGRDILDTQGDPYYLTQYQEGWALMVNGYQVDMLPDPSCSEEHAGEYLLKRVAEKSDNCKPVAVALKDLLSEIKAITVGDDLRDLVDCCYPIACYTNIIQTMRIKSHIMGL